MAIDLSRERGFMVGDKYRLIPRPYAGKDLVILTLFIRTPVWFTSSARTNPIMPGTGEPWGTRTSLPCPVNASSDGLAERHPGVLRTRRGPEDGKGKVAVTGAKRKSS